ncbi:head-tail connector protein [Erythrobacter sp. W53]|uniref:head-tail connector protein n=1 Tax=Erythrobacter sp. W53 TaxID=3425947 RepID=UPI003D768F78
MVRTAVSHPDFSGEPLGDLKQFLSITVERDDALLERLLQSAHALYESFTGRIALASVFDETIAPSGAWQTLNTNPVILISQAELIDPDGVLEALSGSDYDVRIDADGMAQVRMVKSTPSDARLIVRVAAQSASSWATLPPDIRHGLVRLAAHAYRERDNGSDGGAIGAPPSSVAALWRPHRRIRL